MDRSQRGGAKETSRPPASSRLTFRAKKNRKRPGSIWSRVPRPAQMADACGRMLRRAAPAAIGVAIVGAIGGAAWAGYHFVTHSPRFAITTIDVRGNHHLSTDQVLADLPAHVGDNVFATSLDGVVRELRAEPWIAKASAHRILPHTIVIDVVEREPAAMADLGGLYLVDETGHPFKRAAIDADDGAGLPIVTGLDRTAYLADPDGTATQIRGALATLASWRASSDRPAIGELHLDAHGALTLHTYDEATAIQLGAADHDVASRMETFDAVWAELTDAERSRATSIHLDDRPDHVTVAFKDP
jgi:cell division septal protein FtsQ